MVRSAAASAAIVALVSLSLFVTRSVDRATPGTIWTAAGDAAHPELSADISSAERERLRAHFAYVESRLRRADVSHLTLAQRVARHEQLEILRTYGQAGVFPHNHSVAGKHVPVFVDEHGTHCAVGYLLAQAGETELVRRIVENRNTATVWELADEPALLAWLSDNGLSAAEAALIQPWYGDIYQVKETDGGFATGTIAFTAASAAASTWNLLARRQGEDWYVPGLIGLATGAASLSWGIHGLFREDLELNGSRETRREPTSTDIAFNFAAGAIAAALGTRTLILGRADGPRAPEVTTGGHAASLELAPVAGLGTGAGLRATLRF